MKHRSEDELLAFALDMVASEDEHRTIADHLEACPECHARLEAINADVGTIAGVRPQCAVSLEPMVASRPSPLHAILRAAALVGVGIVVGLGAGSRFSREPVFVLPSYVETSSHEVSGEASVVSDATAIPDEYYERLAK